MVGTGVGFQLGFGVRGWFMGGCAAWFLRAGLIAVALFMIEVGLLTDLIGEGTAVAIYFVRKVFQPRSDATIPVRGAE